MFRKQDHSGTGDNVGRDKIVYNFILKQIPKDLEKNYKKEKKELTIQML